MSRLINRLKQEIKDLRLPPEPVTDAEALAAAVIYLAQEVNALRETVENHDKTLFPVE